MAIIGGIHYFQTNTFTPQTPCSFGIPLGDRPPRDQGILEEPGAHPALRGQPVHRTVDEKRVFSG